MKDVLRNWVCPIDLLSQIKCNVTLSWGIRSGGFNSMYGSTNITFSRSLFNILQLPKVGALYEIKNHSNPEMYADVSLSLELLLEIGTILLAILKPQKAVLWLVGMT
jgi:hypothetical protein